METCSVARRLSALILVVTDSVAYDRTTSVTHSAAPCMLRAVTLEQPNTFSVMRLERQPTDTHWQLCRIVYGSRWDRQKSFKTWQYRVAVQGPSL